MKSIFLSALFIFSLTASSASQTADATWVCTYNDSHESFTLKFFTTYNAQNDTISEYILIDGKYKVFYRRTEEDPSLGDFYSVYTNNGYTYVVLADDGMLFMDITPHNQKTRGAVCE